MTIPNFKVGDQVVFDHSTTVNFPRWNVDEEYPGPYAEVKGEVIKVEECYIDIQYTFNGCTKTWSWVIESRYSDFYNKPGYLRLCGDKPIAKVSTKKKCDCPIDILMGIGCQCGGV